MCNICTTENYTLYTSQCVHTVQCTVTSTTGIDKKYDTNWDNLQIIWDIPNFLSAMNGVCFEWRNQWEFWLGMFHIIVILLYLSHSFFCLYPCSVGFQAKFVWFLTLLRVKIFRDLGQPENFSEFRVGKRTNFWIAPSRNSNFRVPRYFYRLFQVLGWHHFIGNKGTLAAHH